jgi:hypothetical protein
MGYKLRQFTPEDKFSQALTLDALAHAICLEDIKAALQAEGAQAQRERKLNMVVVVLVALAMNIYTHLSLRHVMQKIAQGLRFVWPDLTTHCPKPVPSRIDASNWASGPWRLYSIGSVGPWRARRLQGPFSLGGA